MTRMTSIATPSQAPARRRWWALPLVALLTLGASVAMPREALAQDDEEEVIYEEEIADDDPSAIIIFREKLSPHGTWMEHPDYGTIWVPSSRVVGADFAPYVSNGRWELTDEGDWLWTSDYDWGHIPFHYGRWVWVSDIGWSWIPGRVYAPAWVVWRTGADGYIGWAPAPPSYYWVDGYSVAWWGTPVAAYVFCPTVHVFHNHVHTHIIHDHDHVRVAAKATTPYVPARPKANGHTAAKPTAGGKFDGTPRIGKGPSLEEAGVKKADAPKTRGKHNAKAKEFMSKDSIAKSKALAKTSAPTTKSATAAGSKAAPATSTKAAGVNGFTAPARSKPSTGNTPTSRPSREQNTKVELNGSKRGDAIKKSPATSGSFEGPATSSPRSDPAAPKQRVSKPASKTRSSAPDLFDTPDASPAPRSPKGRRGSFTNNVPSKARGTSPRNPKSTSSPSGSSSTPRGSISRPSSPAPSAGSPPSASKPSKAAPKSGGSVKRGGGRSGGKRR